MVPADYDTDKKAYYALNCGSGRLYALPCTMHSQGFTNRSYQCSDGMAVERSATDLLLYMQSTLSYMMITSRTFTLSETYYTCNYMIVVPCEYEEESEEDVFGSVQINYVQLSFIVDFNPLTTVDICSTIVDIIFCKIYALYGQYKLRFSFQRSYTRSLCI